MSYIAATFFLPGVNRGYLVYPIKTLIDKGSVALYSLQHKLYRHDMNGFIGLAVLVFFFFIVLVVVKKQSAENDVIEEGPWPFYAKRVLSNPEQVLYHRLVETLPGCLVMPQVQLTRFIGVKKRLQLHEMG